MASEIKKEIKLEIGHVLFMDIVGYSKLLTGEQRAARDALNQVVRNTDTFREADETGRLIKSPTGDGMALVFRESPEQPTQCALEISRALKTHPNLPLRIGIHSGPASGVVDVNDMTSVAGAGVNMAQRVMDCGDAGHILVSKHVAEDLEHDAEWKPLLHDLGECEVKHGVRVRVLNLYTDELGNPEPPQKFKRGPVSTAARRAVAQSIRMSALFPAALIIVALAIAAFLFWQRQKPKSSAVASAISEKSIAVLPFENLSADPNNAYFAVGIQDEILTRLAKISALKVISHTSTQHYDARPANLPEIARQLGVANILEGSVQRAADQAHINVQLVRAATNEHLWAESYDRKLEKIFDVEREVASAVADALKAKLTGSEEKELAQRPTNNLEAYDSYLRGVALWRDIGIRRVKAIEPLDQAVRLDPNFALAWALLAQAHSLSYSWKDTTPAKRAEAENSLETALRLQPDLPEAGLAQAFYQYWVLRDFDAARQSFESLRRRLPNSSDIPEGLSYVCARQGRWEESFAEIQRAVALNPRDRLLRIDGAWTQHAMRNFGQALQSFDQALDTWPDDSDLIAGKADVYQALGELDQSDALLRRFQHLRNDVNNFWGIGTFCRQAIFRRQYADAIALVKTWLDHVDGLPVRIRAGYRKDLADLQRLAGDSASAKNNYSQVRDELEGIVDKQQLSEQIYSALSESYAGLGDPKRALELSNQAIGAATTAREFGITPSYEETKARVAARFGMKDVAIPALERLLKMQYGDPITPALLRLDPDFDPLRGDPRFEKLAHSDGK